MKEPLIQVSNLKKYFQSSKGTVHAVDNVSFCIEKGKTLGVVGESGCGKSTLGRNVIRLQEPTSGTVLFENRDVGKFSKTELWESRREMQMIFQDPFSSLNPRMTISQTIEEPLKLYKICPDEESRKRKIAELMDTVGLARRFYNTYPHELDGGRRQRIGIARALALNPKFIVCDEPVSALDVSIQAQIINLMQDLQAEFDLTYMFITHDLSVVYHISDDIMVMYAGQIVEKGTAKEMVFDPLHPYSKGLMGSIIVPEEGVREQKLTAIPGTPPNLKHPPEGCRFADRCPYAQPTCRGMKPEVIELPNGREYRCLMSERKIREVYANA